MAENNEDEKVCALRSILHKTQSMKNQNCTPAIDTGLDYNEVYPNIFLSDGRTAKNKEFLKEMGITRILNAAEGRGWSSVDTNAKYYQDIGIEYLGFQLDDVPSESISPFFQQATEFIDEGLKSGGKVLVHCYQGISRSSTFVLAYLMLKKNMSVEDALRQTKERRWIWPNDGFLTELIKLDRQLRLNS